LSASKKIASCMKRGRTMWAIETTQRTIVEGPEASIKAYWGLLVHDHHGTPNFIHEPFWLRHNGVDKQYLEGKFLPTSGTPV